MGGTDDRPVDRVAADRNVDADLTEVGVGSAADEWRLDQTDVLGVSFRGVELDLDDRPGPLLLLARGQEAGHTGLRLPQTNASSAPVPC